MQHPGLNKIYESIKKQKGGAQDITYEFAEKVYGFEDGKYNKKELIKRYRAVAIAIHPDKCSQGKGSDNDDKLI